MNKSTHKYMIIHPEYMKYTFILLLLNLVAVNVVAGNGKVFNYNV